MERRTNEFGAIVFEVVENLIQEYDLPPLEVTDETRLIETLGLTSIDIMHLLSSIDMRLSKHLPYDTLVLKNGEYISDISIGEIIDFVIANVDKGSNEPKNIFETR
jgi:acyl carrier protein